MATSKRAPVAADQTGDIMVELTPDRFVEMELGPESIDRRLIEPLADHRQHGISGRDVQQYEGDHEDPEQDWDRVDDSAEGVLKHRGRQTYGWWAGGSNSAVTSIAPDMRLYVSL